MNYNYYSKTNLELMRIKEHLKFDWEKEYLVMMILLAIIIIFLVYGTYYTCKGNLFDCIIQFIT
jgi:hypothetical protein